MIVDIDLKTGKQTIAEPMNKEDHQMAQQILESIFQLCERRKRANQLKESKNYGQAITAHRTT